MSNYLVIDNNSFSRRTVSTMIYEFDPNAVVYEMTSIDEQYENYTNIDRVIIKTNKSRYPKSYIDYMNHVLRISPDIKFVGICECNNGFVTEELIKHGMKSIISYECGRVELTSAIRSANIDQVYISRSFKTQINDGHTCTNREVEKSRVKLKLTIRQKQVLDYIRKGYANKLIAYELGVSEGTVKLHVSSILKSLKVSNRTEAALKLGALSH